MEPVDVDLWACPTPPPPGAVTIAGCGALLDDSEPCEATPTVRATAQATPDTGTTVFPLSYIP